ncbi:MAG: hypothetical protein DSZ06_03075 [Sulfurospirillum sp.]|nr:MAG: hypothetical protein DSZ06_03075 [Sulfurospirillum sp.]
MELTQLLSIHSLLVKLFLGFILAGFAVALVPKSIDKIKRASFIYTMIFQLIATAILATGIYAIVAFDVPFGMSEIIMSIVWAIMMFVEIKKHKYIKNSAYDDIGLAKKRFLTTSIIELLLTAGVVVMMILKAKGVLAI